MNHCLIDRSTNFLFNNQNACYVFNAWGHNAIPVVSVTEISLCPPPLLHVARQNWVSVLLQHGFHCVFLQYTSKAVGNIWCNIYGEVSLLCMCRRKLNVYGSWRKMDFKVILRNVFVFFSQEGAWLCLMAQLGRSQGSRWFLKRQYVYQFFSSPFYLLNFM